MPRTLAGYSKFNTPSPFPEISLGKFKELTFGGPPLPAMFDRCQTNMERVRQSRPDSGLGFKVKVLTTIPVVRSSHGSIRALTKFK